MTKKSAGILAYRIREGMSEVFLVHPGGPFWAKKDLGTWSIPKGEYEEGEDPLKAAKREFLEETGQQVDGTFIALKPCRLKSGKLVQAWAVEANPDENNIVSNEFETEWPPRSGKKQRFPEVDKAGWFSPYLARQKLNPGQIPLIDELEKILDSGPA